MGVWVRTVENQGVFGVSCHRESEYSAKSIGNKIARFGMHNGSNGEPREPDPLILKRGLAEIVLYFPYFIA